MRLTLTLYKIPGRWILKKQWAKKAVYTRKRVQIPPYIARKGYNIIDAASEYMGDGKPYPVWTPENLDDPRWQPEPCPEDHPDWNNQAVYEYSKDCKLLLGMNQVVNLTKTQVFTHLPDTINNLKGQVTIPDQDKLLQRYIMQAYKWDPTKEKLPRRHNPDLPIWKPKAETGIPKKRSIALLLQNMLRLASYLGSKHSDLLLSRRLLQDNYTSVSYAFTDGIPIHIRFCSDWLMTSDRPLASLATDQDMDASAMHELPDLYPIQPTIELKQTNIYRPMENITGMNEGFTHSHPHTIVLNEASSLDEGEMMSRALMYCYAQTTAQAKKLYGWNVKLLPQPITIQCIQSTGTSFNFLVFQLNTLDFSSSGGIKNIAWMDTGNELFKQLIPKRSMLRNTKYEDYNPQVFEKFLAFYLNGADLTVR